MHRRTSASHAGVLLLACLAGCGGGDEKTGAKPVDGTFVGRLSGTDAFVAVVASPPAQGKAQPSVQVYVSDGGGLSEFFQGSVKGDRFVATSDDGDSKADGRLEEGSVSGTVELPKGGRSRYEAGVATGAAGLYELSLASDGELSGASSAGVGITGDARRRRRGTGTLKLADGQRRRFAIASGRGDGAGHLEAGRVRVILLPGGQLRGAGKTRGRADSRAFFLRSSAG
jgi:hypothetical protein